MHVLEHIAVAIIAIAALVGVVYFARWRNGGLWPWQDAASSTSTRSDNTSGTQAPK